MVSGVQAETVTLMDDNHGQYIYAITTDDVVIGEGLLGLGGEPVRRVASDGLVAIVSEMNRPKVRPERRNLAAHMQVIKKMMEDTTVLPIAFGMVAADLESVGALLRRNHDVLAEQLDNVAGKVEMGLRIRWDVANVFDFFVTTRPDLRAARDNLGDVHEASRDQRIALGRFFEEVITDERERIFDEVSAVFERYGIELRNNPPRDEKEALNLACLVERSRHDDFDRAVGDAASSFDASYTFGVSGPWAPSSFVDFALEV